jgi:putative peptide zinc metalloprotease protein
MRKLLLLFATLVAALGLAGGLPAAARADNAAIAINTKDGAAVFKVAFKIRRAMGDVVDETNAAVAFSSCDSCSTAAIAFEIVLISDTASTVTPTNIAISINQDCTLCVTVAEAYQFVVSNSGPVHFTADGNKMLADIRKELQDLKHQDLTIDELQTKLDDIAGRIAYVLAHEMVVGAPPGQDDHGGTTTETTGTETTPTVSTPTTTETEPTTTTTTTEPTTTGVTTTSSP